MLEEDYEAQIKVQEEVEEVKGHENLRDFIANEIKRDKVQSL